MCSLKWGIWLKAHIFWADGLVPNPGPTAPVSEVHLTIESWGFGLSVKWRRTQYLALVGATSMVKWDSWGQLRQDQAGPGDLVSCSTVTFTTILRSRSETGFEIIFSKKATTKSWAWSAGFQGAHYFSVEESTEAMQKALVLCTSMNHTSEVLLFNGFWLESNSQTHFSHFILKRLF